MRMRRGTLWCAVAMCVMGVGVARGDAVSVSKMALVTVDGSIEVGAPAARVWAALTDADKVRSWCPLWRKAPAVARPLTTLGASIAFEDEYGNTGKSVVIFVDPAHELRVAHVPDNGSYLCQTKFVLSGKGSATVIRATEQYSDALDVPTDRDTAVSTRNEIAQYLNDLKAISEKK
jgi:uncharacterized protein YndB with AHSA1/START domain